jgi:hypothetical protein
MVGATMNTKPIHDIELIVAACLRLQIFGDVMKIQTDPYAKDIAEAQRLGRFPKNLVRRTIFTDSAQRSNNSTL